MRRDDEKRKIVYCPHCGAATAWYRSNPYRPFCSERCKLIDLGQWASDGYRIPQAEPDKGNADDEA
ncbi:MAG: DNA gyrase inhibitor YacG [Burkholderiales bacterium]